MARSKEKTPPKLTACPDSALGFCSSHMVTDTQASCSCPFSSEFPPGLLEARLVRLTQKAVSVVPLFPLAPGACRLPTAHESSEQAQWKHAEFRHARHLQALLNSVCVTDNFQSCTRCERIKSRPLPADLQPVRVHGPRNFYAPSLSPSAKGVQQIYEHEQDYKFLAHGARPTTPPRAQSPNDGHASCPHKTAKHPHWPQSIEIRTLIYPPHLLETLRRAGARADVDNMKQQQPATLGILQD